MKKILIFIISLVALIGIGIVVRHQFAPIDTEAHAELYGAMGNAIPLDPPLSPEVMDRIFSEVKMGPPWGGAPDVPDSELKMLIGYVLRMEEFRGEKILGIGLVESRNSIRIAITPRQIAEFKKTGTEWRYTAIGSFMP